MFDIMSMRRFFFAAFSVIMWPSVYKNYVTIVAHFDMIGKQEVSKLL